MLLSITIFKLNINNICPNNEGLSLPTSKRTQLQDEYKVCFFYS